MSPSPAPGKLLREEPPLIVLPYLAATIGLPEALLLQQIHYWLQRAGKERDGRLWIYNTYADWAAQMPFWSETAIRRIVRRLEHLGLIFVANYNRKAFDRTLWYSINYEAVAALSLTEAASRLSADEADTARSTSDPACSATGTPCPGPGTPCSATGTPCSATGTPCSATGTPCSATGTPCGEIGAAGGEIGAPIPEITSEITSETNTEREGEITHHRRAPSPPTVENLTNDDAWTAWLAAESAGTEEEGKAAAADFLNTLHAMVRKRSFSS